MNVTALYEKYAAYNAAVIDSRKVSQGDLFFAFSGENYNAATMAKTAMAQGALAVFLEDETYADPENHIHFVGSTLAFLQEFASHHRSQLRLPIIGLTGSNGKTTTKELMHAVLSQKYKTQYTKGNLNNHIGVPLTLLSIKKDHELAIVEMGANHQKEIENLCTIARPTLGYITNFGFAHLEGFGGPEGVVKGKSELYEYIWAHGGTVLLNGEDAKQRSLNETYPDVLSFNMSTSPYQFQPVAVEHRVGVQFENKVYETQLTGIYNFPNVCAAFTLGLHFGVPLENIAAGLRGYQPENMRSQILSYEGKTIILDAYNANPSSMQAALMNLANFPGKKLAILGDMRELGTFSAEEHRKVLETACALGIDKMLTVGEEFQKVEEHPEAVRFLDVAELRTVFSKMIAPFDVILIKGSRGISLEKLLAEPQ